MTAHLYTTNERAAHLQELETAVAALLPALDAHPEFAAARASYAQVMGEARRLLATEFAQAELTALAGAVPTLFWLHRDWAPPLDEIAPGRWAVPDWYATLEPLERRVVRAAEQLRVVGYR